MDYSSADSVSKHPQARTQTLLIHVAVLSRSLLLAIAVDMYLEKKEGVPVRSKASQREGTWEKSEKYKPGSSSSAG